MSDAQPPAMLSDEQVQERFRDGPSVRKATLVLIGRHIYKRESDGWRLLDSRSHKTIDDMIEGNRGS